MKKIILSSILIATLAQAENFSKTVYTKVISSEPIYSKVVEYVSIDSCEEVKEPISSTPSGTNVAGTLVGGIVGGVLGHQIGGGSGKALATVGGAILGGVAGNKMTSSDEPQASYQIVKKCYTKQIPQEKTVLSGYSNKGIVDGREINIISESKLTEIPVTISYSY